MAAKKPNPEKRVQTGEDRRARTRSSILRASFELLGRPEGRSSRIDEICQAAGVSRATFYNYFSSVEELFRATAFAISHDFNDAVRAVIRRVPGGAIRLAFALRYNLHRVRQDAAWGWAMVNISAGGPIFGEEASRYAVETIEEGLVTEQFAIPNVAIGFDLVMGSALSAMITLLRSEQAEDYPELMVSQILRGLGVSETLIGKCTLPPLPDPFEFMAAHGMGSEHDLIDASPFLSHSHRG
jgi:AcrR family transcriptional regulator